MDYSKIHIAKRVLEVAGLLVPATDEEIRKNAYEYLATRDFLAAHQIRLGKNYSDFTEEDWQEVIRLSGKEKVRDNMGASACCMRYGLM